MIPRTVKYDLAFAFFQVKASAPAVLDAVSRKISAYVASYDEDDNKWSEYKD